MDTRSGDNLQQEPNRKRVECTQASSMRARGLRELRRQVDNGDEAEIHQAKEEQAPECINCSKRGSWEQPFE